MMGDPFSNVRGSPYPKPTHTGGGRLLPHLGGGTEIGNGRKPLIAFRRPVSEGMETAHPSVHSQSFACQWAQGGGGPLAGHFARH